MSTPPTLLLEYGPLYQTYSLYHAENFVWSVLGLSISKISVVQYNIVSFWCIEGRTNIILRAMASGINIYSFSSDIQKIFWISEKEFVISEILAH